MILPCKFYSNQARLSNALRFLSDQPSFRFFCVNGLITRTRKEFRVLTDSVTVVVSCVMPGTGKASTMLVTSDTSLSNMDGKDVDTDTIPQDNVYYNLCALLQEKYSVSNNDVSVTFTHPDGIVTVSINEGTEGSIRCIMQATEGELVAEGDDVIRQFLGQVTGIASFSYNTTTDDFRRKVSISDGYTEIMKEISRYLNRTLVFVAFLAGNEMMEQYVGFSSALEIITRANGVRVYKKVAGSKLRELKPFCVYQSTARVDDIIREQGRALDSTRR